MQQQCTIKSLAYTPQVKLMLTQATQYRQPKSDLSCPTKPHGIQPSRSDLNHICRWFENSTFTQIGFHVGFFWFVLPLLIQLIDISWHLQQEKQEKSRFFQGLVVIIWKTKVDICSMYTHQLASPAAAPASTTQASSQSLHSHKSAPPHLQAPHPLHTTPYMWRRGEERGEERRRGGETERWRLAWGV